ncbi:MAG: HEAT repeat domain-containing protein, partial [Kamptonema sp. SIO4C4]|nr:HEAT repeat domain-containing protein [Kamptonema sp. SIO4C4]
STDTCKSTCNTFSLAEIGHPHALDNLLEAASSDFALSVRRAATKGLGSLQWSKLPPEEQQAAQEKVLQVLLQVSVDVEWVVRYAAIVGLQGLAQQQPAFIGQIGEHLQQRQSVESELAVQARVVLALQQLEQTVA